AVADQEAPRSKAREQQATLSAGGAGEIHLRLPADAAALSRAAHTGTRSRCGTRLTSVRSGRARRDAGRDPGAGNDEGAAGSRVRGEWLAEKKNAPQHTEERDQERDRQRSRRTYGRDQPEIEQIRQSRRRQRES